jgi:hypothetical protein
MQITSTVPVRTSFYTYSVDWERIGFEALLYLCMIFVLASQVRLRLARLLGIELQFFFVELCLFIALYCLIMYCIIMDLIQNALVVLSRP